MSCELLVITGPTASGKTTRGIDCAKALDGEIVSADSRQIYRGMDLGTGKDLDEYGDVPYHLIDIMPAGYKYNLYEYLRDANAAIDAIRAKGKLPIVVGGTGMYVEALLNGLRLPEVPQNHALRHELEGKTLAELTEILASMKTLHNTTDVDTAKRAIRAIEIETYYREHPDMASNAMPSPVKNAVVVGVDIPRDLRRERITQRLRKRLDKGMIDEVRRLLDSGITADDLIYYGLEYKFLTEHILGKTTFDEMFHGLETAIHQFAKRQMTWFRGMERRGHSIKWLPFDLPGDAFVNQVKSFVSEC